MTCPECQQPLTHTAALEEIGDVRAAMQEHRPECSTRAILEALAREADAYDGEQADGTWR